MLGVQRGDIDHRSSEQLSIGYRINNRTDPRGDAIESIQKNTHLEKEEQFLFWGEDESV